MSSIWKSVRMTKLAFGGGKKMTLDEAIKHCEEVADADCYSDEQLRCSETFTVSRMVEKIKRL